MKPSPPTRPISRHPRRRPLIALGAAAAASVVSTPRVHADIQPPSPVAAPADAATLAFDIAPGSIDEVMAAFERVSGLRVVLTNPDLATLASPGVRGIVTAREAMAALLTGNAVEATFSPGTVTLAIADIAEQVDVTGRGPALSSSRYVVPLRDVAQTIAVVPRDVIEQRAAFTLTDTLRNVPGITLQAGEGGGASNTAGDMFTMRGFSANNSLFVDNVRDSGLIARDVFNIDQVEVFMGPTGSDVGRGTAAGYVNMQTKRAQAGTSASVTAIGGTADRMRVTADVNVGTIGAPDAAWLRRSAVRLNALWQERGVPGRDFTETASQAVAPAVALGLGSPTRVYGSAQFVRQDNLPDYGIPSAGWLDDLLSPTTIQAPAPVRQANYYGSPAYDYDRADQSAFLVRVEHDINRTITVSNQTRVNATEREAVISTITNNAAYVPATGLVTISRQGNARRNTIISNQSTVVARVATGAVRHGLSAGVDVMREAQDAPTMVGIGTRAPVNLFAPNPNDPVQGDAPARSRAGTEGHTRSVALHANDAVEVGQRWLLSAGFRLDRYETTYRAVDAAGSTTTDLSDQGTLFSGRASALYRVTDAANLYLSYGTTVTPPGEGNFQLSAAANNANNPDLDPQRSANLELGAKAAFAGNRLALTGAVFRTRNRNIVYTIDAAAAPPVFNQDDDQLVMGLTAGALGQVTARWRVLANAAWLSTSLQSQGPNNGRRLTLTPAFSGSLWTTVRVAGGLSIGGGLQHVSTSYANTANTIRVPGCTLADGLVEYVVNSHLTLRANVHNVFDTEYVTSVNNNGGRYNPGQPRSGLLSSQIRF